MRPRRFRLTRLVGVLVLVCSAVSSLGLPAPHAAAQLAAPPRVQPAVTSVTPITTLVTEAYSQWTIGAGLLYWADCEDVPAVPPGKQSPKIGPAYYRGYLRRMPTHGGTIDTIYTTAFCDQYMAADASGLFSWDGTSIEKRPIDAPDKPFPIYTPGRAGPFPQPPATPFVLDGNYLYYASNYRIVRLAKDGSSFMMLATVSGTPTSLVIDNGFVAWLDGSGLSEVDKTCSTQPCSTYHFSSTTGDHLLYAPYFSGSFRTPLYWVNGPNLYGLRCVFLRCSAVVVYSSPAGGNLGRLGTDGHSLFWPETVTSCSGGGGFCTTVITSIHRMALGSSSADTIADDIAGTHPALATDDLGVYFEDPDLARLPFNAAAIVRDLRPDAWEVTQGIQSLNNDVPLVAGKPTYVRVYGKELNGPPASTIEAVLQGSRGANPLPGSPLRPLNGARSMQTGSAYDRGKIGDGWLFQLPADWSAAGSITLNVVVDPRNLYTKPQPAANQLGGSFNFANKAPVCAVFIPVRTNAPAASTDDPNFWTMIDRFKTLWPVPDVWTYKQDDDIAKLEIKWGGPFDLIPYPGYGPYEIPDNNNRIITSMIERDILSDDPNRCDDVNARTHYVGMVHPDTDTGSNDGFANYAFAASWVKLPPHATPPPVGFNSPKSGSVMAQEMSHNYNGVFGHRWKHVNCGGPDGINTDYPYNPCTLDDKATTDPAVHYGFDVLTGTPIAPTMAADYMSYGPTKWVSDYSWKGMFDETENQAPSNGASRPAAATDLAAGALVALASGVITPSLNQAQLNPVLVLPTNTMSPAMLRKWQRFAPGSRPQSGPADHSYHLQLLGTDGSVLSDQPVTLNPNDDDGPDQSGGFTLTWTPPAATVGQVALLDGTTVLTTINPGTSNPTISLQQPTGGITVDNQMTVSWKSADADTHDRLFYTIQYSPDLGKTWRALITDLPDPGVSDTMTVQFNHLGGIPASTTGGVIRVAASDGYHTALASSQPFTVTNRAPEPHIATPLDNQTLVAGEGLSLHGSATDVEDGGLSGAALSWTVDGNAVGTGGTANVDGLAPGAHDVALTAKDSAGKTQTVHATVNVDAVQIPLSVEPTLDGNCDDPAYAGGTHFSLYPYRNGSHATAHLVRTATDLWVCFSGMVRSTSGPGTFAGLHVDVNNSRDATMQPDDAGFFVGENGTPSTGSEQLHAMTSATGTSWNAEMSIPATAIGGFNHLVGLDLAQYWLNGTGNDFHWPYSSGYDQPNTWALTDLGDVPAITAVSPDRAIVGDGPLTLTITATNVLTDSAVQWNGSPRPTTYVDARHLTAQIDAADLVAPGHVPITLVNPEFPTAPSNPVYFTVQNPAPVLLTLSPPSVTVGDPALTMTVSGKNFVSGAQVIWNGVPVATNFVSATRVDATLTAAQLAVAQTVDVAVVNPEPRAGASNTLRWSIAGQPVGSRVLLPMVRR